MKKTMISFLIAIGTVVVVVVARAARVEMAWHFPLTQSHQGIPFGNAVNGYLVWGEGRTLKVTIGRDDVWDHRGGYDWHDDQSYTNIVSALYAGDYGRVRELFRRGEQKPGEPKNPQIIPVGHIEFTLPEGLSLDAGVLDTGSGLALITLVRGTDPALDGEPAGQIALALDRADGVLALRWPKGVAPEGTCVPAWKNEQVAKELAPILFKPPTDFAWEGESGAGFVQTLPEDPAVAAGFISADGATYLTAVRGDNVETSKAALVAALGAWKGCGFEAVKAASEKFWNGWWKKTSEIDVPDTTIREIHDFGLYKFGSMTGPDGVPAPLQGPWIEEYRLPPWHGDYHFNINVQMCYWPAYRGNHLESLKPLFAMVKRWWPILRDNARKFVGIEDGFMLPHSVDDRCRLIGGYWAGTMDHACTAWTCQMMFRSVMMSGDIDFLRTDAYPLMKGAMNVYRAMMEEREGQLSLPASTSPEFDSNPGWGRDASFQLAAAHRLARDLIRAAGMLGEKPDPMWLDVEKRLPLAAFKGGKPGGEIELWRGLTLPESHRHHSHLAGYVPFDVLNYDEPAIRRSTILSFNRWQCEGLGLWSGWAFPWAAMLQLHMGHADAADLTLHMWERMFTNPGHGSRHDPYFPGFCLMRKGTFSPCGEAMEIMQIDGAMAATAAVQEMFVHERNGVIHVFQGAPLKWRQTAFRNILSDEGVLVGASRKKGKVLHVDLEATHDAEIRLASPWKGGEVLTFKLAAGEKRRLEPKKGETICSTK